eukprot:4346137-Amphidinium_carterae.1
MMRACLVQPESCNPSCRTACALFVGLCAVLPPTLRLLFVQKFPVAKVRRTSLLYFTPPPHALLICSSSSWNYVGVHLCDSQREPALHASLAVGLDDLVRCLKDF